MTYLFHDSCFPFREGGVTPQFILDVFHFDFDTAFSFFAVSWRRLLRLKGVVVVADVTDAAGLQTHLLVGPNTTVVVTQIGLQAAGGPRHHRVVAWRQLLEARRGPAQARTAIYLGRGLSRQQIHAVA